MSAMSNHWQAARAAFTEERARKKSRIPQQETAFLPAALEVIERPVSPTGRITAWTLLAGLATTTGWLVFGHVDIVASAPGRIMPTDDVKLVQAANAGIVRHIYVHDGDVVHRGQPLVDLDPTVSTAEEAQANSALMAADLDIARNQAIADGLSGRPAHFRPPAATPSNVVATQQQLIAAQVNSALAAASGFAAARSSSLSEADSAAAQVRTYSQTGPVLDRELDAMNALAAKGYAPGLKLLDLQRQRRSEAGSQEMAVAEQARSLSDARKFGAQVAQAQAQARQGALADLAKAQNDAMLRREELTKAIQKSRIQRLVSPVDGTVQQLAVHTIGGVVEAVRSLMVIVPDGSLVVEAHVANKDAGFVKPGQPVAVKLEAFPFTRYGSVPGHIVSISRDAVQDNTKAPPYYVARIALSRRTVKVEGETVQLRPGLTAISDVRLGSRSIISYLLSPLDAGVHEAGREH